MKILNFFNRDFYETRVQDILCYLFEHLPNSSLAKDISSMLCYDTWSGFEYNQRAIKKACKFLKKYKFSLFSDEFDYKRLVKCIQHEESNCNTDKRNNFISNIINKFC